MFQVEPILWLQSFESSFFTWLMSSISLLGYSIVYGILITVITFGLNLRKGIAIFMILVIGGIATYSLKNGLKFPRPSDIDIRVNEPNHAPTLKLINQGAGETFWSLPKAEAMAAVKIQEDWSYGLPSGHVSAATAFVLSLFVFFRKRSLFIFALCWIFLMALSRIYLGRHFIADVLVGAFVGMIVVLLGRFLLKPLEVTGADKLEKKAFIPILILVVPLILLSPFLQIIDADNVGRLSGLVLVYFIINQMGHASDEGKVKQRVLRTLVAIVCSALIAITIMSGTKAIGLTDAQIPQLIKTCLLTAIPFIGAFALLKRLNLYKTGY